MKSEKLIEEIKRLRAKAILDRAKTLRNDEMDNDSRNELFQFWSGYIHALHNVQVYVMENKDD